MLLGLLPGVASEAELTDKLSTRLPPGAWAECRRVWAGFPDKALLAALWVAWIGLFQVLGTSTLGYVSTPSIMGWWLRAMTRGPGGNPFKVLAR